MVSSREKAMKVKADLVAKVVVLLLAAAPPSGAQEAGPPSADGLWTPVDASRLASRAESRGPGDSEPAPGSPNVRLYELNDASLRQKLEQSPAEEAAPAGLHVAKTIITLPLADGSFERFAIEETAVMAPELAAKFPELRTFRGQGVDDPSARARLTLSATGFYGWVQSERGQTVIDPNGNARSPGVPGLFEVAGRGDAGMATGAPFECLVESEPEGDQNRSRGLEARVQAGHRLRTYRLAVAATGEYTAQAGGTKALALEQIVTTIDRVTGIYENEVGVRLQLVANNDQIIFEDAGSDPFTDNDPNVLIGQSQREIDRRIGNANYDIGHTFSTGAGGLASLRVVTVPGQKARGVTGRDNPFGDPFDVDYVAHEIGHQFGGDHTFNGTRRSCSGRNRNALTAFEPGSGITIQAYAGICDLDNLADNSEPYFHAISFEQIVKFTTQGAASSVPPVSTGNNFPTVDAGGDFTIPRATPFRLTAQGQDPDPGDRLTYCWEQMDRGPAAPLEAPDDGLIPLFRSGPPAPSPSRTFPPLGDILNGLSSRGQTLPSLGRSMQFRVTVRDNRVGGGGVSSDDMELRIHAASGPFRVTEPRGSRVRSGLLTVKWDVAGTNLPPISTEFVNILLSDDGGQNFRFNLAISTKNDGEELVALPNVAGSNMRIKVESVGNVFFALSPDDFAIQPARLAVVAVRHGEAETAGGDSRALTPAGLERALSLSRLLGSSQIGKVFSTNTRRTQGTARPTADSLGLPVEPYAEPERLAQQLLAGSRQRVLVVGHSDTTPELLRALGVAAPVTIGENEFNRLFIVTVPESGPVLFEETSYEITQE
jgi:phosphohistidine phosphatase SixA